jgi:hypothetical protein
MSEIEELVEQYKAQVLECTESGKYPKTLFRISGCDFIKEAKMRVVLEGQGWVRPKMIGVSIYFPNDYILGLWLDAL